MSQTTMNLTQLLDTFQLIDKNKDGSISFDELRSACIKLHIPVDKNRLKDLFPRGHRISFEEFCRVMQDFTPSSDSDAYFHETFRAFDRNSDGFISVKEIQRTMKNLGERLSYKQAKEMLKVADRNGDGKLSREEFRILFDQLNEFTHSPPNSPNDQSTSSFPLFQ